MPRLTSWERKSAIPRRKLFDDASPHAARLMRPSLFTRISDRFVSFLSKFERHKLKADPITDEHSFFVSPSRAVVSFGLFAFLVSAGGRHEEAPLFFAALGFLIFGLTAWVDWHRANPPGESATTRRGIVKALLHALGALAVGLFFVYEIRRVFPFFTERLDWVHQIVELMLPAGLAVMAYQRRTGWERDDPESPMIEGTIAAVLAAVLFLIKGLL